ncbi:MAG: hypothetical protein ABJN65_17810 [Parasphingorhabdus sp.]
MRILFIVMLTAIVTTFAIGISGIFSDIAFAGITPPGPYYENRHDVYGTFVTDEGSAKIRIEDCGDETLCGYFVWFNEKMPPRVSSTTKFAGKAGQPLLGSLMLKNFFKKSQIGEAGKYSIATMTKHITLV